MAHNSYLTAILVLSILMKSNAYSIETVESSPKTEIGTCSFWCKQSQSLYYVDPFGIQCAMLRYCPADNRVYCACVDGHPLLTFIAPIEGRPDEYAVGSTKSVEIVQWDGKSPKAKWIRTVFVTENCTEYEFNTMNDAKADKHGRLFVNTKRADLCFNLTTVLTNSNLFRICAGEPPVTLIEPGTLRFPNGMALDEKNNMFYLIDSCAVNIVAYDYCPYTGDIWNGRIIFNYTEFSISPIVKGLKALEIDKDGNLWAAVFGSGEILEIDPKAGVILQRIQMPALQLSSLSFCGPNLRELCVGSSTFSLPAPGRNEGQLFILRHIDARGCEVNKAKL